MLERLAAWLPEIGRRQDARRAAPPTVILGVGSGRCGTRSLATLLSRQPYTVVQHECPPLLPWNPAAAPHSMAKRFSLLIRRFRGARWIGDVASYYLPYVESVLDEFPACRVVCLKRDREQTVNSFVRWVRKWHGPNVNHWSENRRGLRRNQWDDCFPKYDTRNIYEAVRQYWDAYYRRAEELAARFPDNMRIFEMDTTLNETDGLRSLLEWIHIPRDDQVLVRVRENAIADQGSGL